jgi:hypothetical protein
MIHYMAQLRYRNHAHRVMIMAPALLQSNANLTQMFDALQHQHGYEAYTTTPRTAIQ